MRKSTWVGRVLLSACYVLTVYSLSWAQGLPVTLTTKLPLRSSGVSFFNTTLKQAYFVNLKYQEVTPLNNYVERSHKPIPFKSMMEGENSVAEMFYSVGGKNYLIYSAQDGKKDELVLYNQEVSASMTRMGSRSVVARFEGATTITTVYRYGQGMSHTTDINIQKSPSGKQIVISRSRTDHTLDVAAFSPEKGPLWKKRFDMDPELDFEIRDARVSETGNTYLSGVYYKKKGDVKLRFLLAYSPASHKHKLHIAPDDKKMDHAGYGVDLLPKGTPLWAGLYEDRSAGQCGYRLHWLDSVTLEITRQTEKPFTKDFHAIVHKKLDLRNFHVAHVLEMRSGDIVFTVEGYTEYATSDGSSWSCHSTQAYLVRVDKQGNERWTGVIQKSQWQDNGSWMVGHHLFYRGDNVYLVYNDNPKNTGPVPTDKQDDDHLRKQVQVVQVEIDNTGKGTRSVLVPEYAGQYSSIAYGDVERIEGTQYRFLFQLADGYQYALLRLNE